MDLTSKQRKYLEKNGVQLKPVVIIGQNGATPALAEQVSTYLECHELIKIKFNEFKDDKQALSQNICEQCNATLVRIIGNTALIFRQNENPEKRIIKLPKEDITTN